MSESIFDPAVYARHAQAHFPRSCTNGSIATAPQPRPAPSSPADAALISIIEAPLQPGETAAAGFARKELELRVAFAALSVLDARALHARLSNPRSGDVLADAFTRITADRRGRLINFLADARRREALKR